MRDDEQGPGPSTDPTETVGMPMPGLPTPGSVLGRGAAVGRYVILHSIGQGGMGVVYAGYDPELDRKVALKLVRPDRAGGEAARLRLLREAQAIARLSHPNVVAVFDTGSFGDQVFIAMELVPGRTLREWLNEGEAGRRPWREVVSLFAAAGRGLAAAHAAGLVHRDFKPENVLLGDDGRVRVVDFGLARPVGAEAEHGVFFGTPGYIAPEQLTGHPADARSDQYSFCVALWEALYGERPARDGGREIPVDLRLPPRLRQALLRGLREDPVARHPSMDALLSVLVPEPWILRRRHLAAAALLVVAASAGLAWERSREGRGRLCRGGEDRVAALWSAPRRQAVHAAFAATRLPYAEATWETVERSLGRYFGNWAAAHREACEATRVRGEQSEDLLDRRMACLDQHLQEAGALVDLFAHADPGLVKEAVKASGALAGLDECSDTAVLRARLPLPRDPALRGRVAAAQQRLARAQALFDAGRDEAALRALDGVAQEARGAAYRPLEAQALYLAGSLQERLARYQEAETTLFGALLAGEAAGDRQRIGLVAAELARTVGFDEARRAEGRRWIDLAQSAIEGLKGSAAIQVRLLNILGSILRRDGLYAEEEAVYRRALAIAERELGQDSPLTADILSNLGVTLNEQGRQEESMQASLRGLAIRRRVLDPGHPDLARSYNTLGNAYFAMGREEEGIAMFRKARDLFAASYGEDHPVTAGVESNLGMALRAEERYGEALQLYQKALRVMQAEAPAGPMVSLVLCNIGEVLGLQKRYAEALSIYRRALAIDEKLLGPGHPDLAYSIKGIGDSLLGLGRAREAVPYFERALAIREAGRVPAESLANSRYSLAQASWAAGDQGRALQLARQAYTGYTGTTGGNSREMAAEVRAWLRAHGDKP